MNEHEAAAISIFEETPPCLPQQRFGAIAVPRVKPEGQALDVGGLDVDVQQQTSACTLACIAGQGPGALRPACRRGRGACGRGPSCRHRSRVSLVVTINHAGHSQPPSEQGFAGEVVIKPCLKAAFETLFRSRGKNGVSHPLRNAMSHDDRRSSVEGSSNPLVLKLRSLSELTSSDVEVLHDVSSKVFNVEAGTVLVAEDERPNGVYLIMKGMACRYKLRSSGARQIMAYLIPGDCGDPDATLLARMDHSIQTMSASEVVEIETSVFSNLLQAHPTIARALRLAALVDEATLREWLLNVGRRSALERIAHLLCELLLRHRAVGFAANDRYAMPLSVRDLADTIGLSSVHVNRAMSELRQRSLVRQEGDSVDILDEAALRELAEFKPNYLHLGGRAAA